MSKLYFAVSMLAVAISASTALAGPNDGIYYTFTEKGTNNAGIYKVGFDGSGRILLVDLGTQSLLKGFEIDSIHQQMFWLDTRAGSTGIWRANLDGSEMTRIIATSTKTIASFDLDVPGGKIYFLSSSGLRVASLDGSGESTVNQTVPWASLVYSMVVAPDADRAFVYSFSDGFCTVPLSGGSYLTNHLSQYFWQMEIDRSSQTIFGIMPPTGIFSLAYDGSAVVQVVPNPGSMSLELDCDNGLLYFGSASADNQTVISRSDLAGGNVTPMATINGGSVWDIGVVGTPEPLTVTTLALGLGAFVARRRRLRK